MMYTRLSYDECRSSIRKTENTPKWEKKKAFISITTQTTDVWAKERSRGQNWHDNVTPHNCVSIRCFARLRQNEARVFEIAREIEIDFDWHHPIIHPHPQQHSSSFRQTNS